MLKRGHRTAAGGGVFLRAKAGEAGVNDAECRSREGACPTDALERPVRQVTGNEVLPGDVALGHSLKRSAKQTCLGRPFRRGAGKKEKNCTVGSSSKIESTKRKDSSTG